MTLRERMECMIRLPTRPGHSLPISFDEKRDGVLLMPGKNCVSSPDRSGRPGWTDLEGSWDIAKISRIVQDAELSRSPRTSAHAYLNCRPPTLSQPVYDT